MGEPVTQFRVNFHASPLGQIAIVTMDNGEDHRKPNTFDAAALQSLNQALDRIVGEAGVAGMMLTGKPHVFAAGADLTQVPFITTFEQGYAIGKLGHDTMKRLLDLPFPTLAAINGVALGGGLEIALYCRYRTVAASVRAIGFPECFLGIIPGWGGCTLGTRLIGPEGMVVLAITNPLSQNRFIDGSRALALGLADRCLAGANFLDDSLQFLLDVIAGKEKVERPPVVTTNVKEIMEQAHRFVDAKVHGAAPAPYRALELIAGACQWDIERGFEEENRALGDLIKSRQCKASLYAFDLVNRYAKARRGIPEEKPRPVNCVGIIGAGLMASQLAHLFITRLGLPVIMKDIDQAILERGCARVREDIQAMADRGRIQAAEARHLSSLLHGTLDYRDFAPCDFVIEAVFEELAVKQQVFAEVEGVIRTDCVLASNTSSLSVSAMAANLTHGERSVGFHFFNPVAVLPLIELIQGRQTDRKTLATAFDVAKRLRKTAILVQDAPAFVVNRLLTRMLVECFAAVAEGASFQDVDTALLALGLPIAPFDLLELVGPAVAHHVLENLNRAYGPERFAISEPFTRMVRANKRSIYLPGSPPRQVDPEVERLWAARPPVSIHPETIRERVLHALATEIDTILKEGVVQSSRDVDLAMILGAGWPFFMGGITMYLDMAGVTPKLLQKVFFEF